MKLQDLGTVTALAATMCDLTEMRLDEPVPAVAEVLDVGITMTVEKLRGLGVTFPDDKAKDEMTIDVFVNVVMPRSRAIVVANGFIADALGPFFPDCKVVPIGGALVGHRFDVIVVVTSWRNEREQRWFEENLATRLKPDGKMVWIA